MVCNQTSRNLEMDNEVSMIKYTIGNTLSFNLLSYAVLHETGPDRCFCGTVSELINMNMIKRPSLSLPALPRMTLSYAESDLSYQVLHFYIASLYTIKTE